MIWGRRGEGREKGGGQGEVCLPFQECYIWSKPSLIKLSILLLCHILELDLYAYSLQKVVQLAYLLQFLVSLNKCSSGSGDLCGLPIAAVVLVIYVDYPLQ